MYSLLNSRVLRLKVLLKGPILIGKISSKWDFSKNKLFSWVIWIDGLSEGTISVEGRVQRQVFIDLKCLDLQRLLFFQRLG